MGRHERRMVVNAESPSVGAVVILDKDGGRVAGSYFEEQFRTLPQQQAFERELFRAATRQPAEGESNIFMCKGLVVVYRSHDETTFFVVGSDEENEVILANVLDALVEACRKLVSARLTTYNVMSKLEYVLLALDELGDGGTILEIEGSAIAARVSMKSTTSDFLCTSRLQGRPSPPSR